jgi:hypothetical protein
MPLFDDREIPHWAETYRDEIEDAAARIVASGAHAPLTFVGMGQFGVVFCDERGVGFKAGRRPDSKSNRDAMAEEAEWLRVASTVPGVREHVARFRRYHPSTVVIERECVKAQALNRRVKADRWQLHRAIEAAMIPYGYAAPEYKDDSYVWSSGRGWILVDASMPAKVGGRLVAEAARTMAGQTEEDPGDLAFHVRMESGRTITPTRAARLSERLETMKRTGARRGVGRVGAEERGEGTVKFLGTTDDVTTCDCCGRKDLKSTVALSFDDADPAYYGTTCAAHALRRDAKYVKQQAKSADDAHAAREQRAKTRASDASREVWFAWLRANAPMTDGRGKVPRDDVFRMIEALGGGVAARARWRAEGGEAAADAAHEAAYREAGGGAPKIPERKRGVGRARRRRVGGDAQSESCVPRVVSSVRVDEVIASYLRTYRQGRRGAEPPRSAFAWMTERGDDWVLASLPLDLLDYQREDEAGPERVSLARSYAARASDPPPGTASYVGRARTRRSGKAFVADGNHRPLAASYRGDCAVRMFMPRPEYEALVSDARWRGLIP